MLFTKLFIKPGHFAKDCPSRSKGKKRAFQQASILISEEFSDLESVLTEEDRPSADTLLMLRAPVGHTLLMLTDTSEDSNTESESEGMYTLDSIPCTPWPVDSLTIPVATVSIYTDKYSHPIRVSALFDTGAAATMAHTSTLPAEYWKPYHRVFKAANGPDGILLLDPLNLVSEPGSVLACYRIV
ncbi:hypothetical protein ACLOJK_009158 [Asimina triloba]